MSTKEHLTERDTNGFWPVGAKFTHGRDDLAVEITVSGEPNQRILTIGDIVVKTEKNTEQPVLPVQPVNLHRRLSAERYFALLIPAQAAWMYTQGMVTIPNETVDCPGLWLCWVNPGFEDEVWTLAMTLDERVASVYRRLYASLPPEGCDV